MGVLIACEGSPGLVNEDFVVVGPGWAVVLDGATARPGVDSGCVHGAAWLVRRLGGAMAGRLAGETGEPLVEVLAGAIEEVGRQHSECDLGNPDSPSAAVAMVRWGTGAEWLALADCPVLVDDGALCVVRDDRVDHLPGYSDEDVRAARNQDGGFWVAAAKPEAAFEALTGEVAQARRVALMSDGASRLVERFGLMGWAELLDLLERPDEVIRRTRVAEREIEVKARGKRYDDATAVLVSR